MAPRKGQAPGATRQAFEDQFDLIIERLGSGMKISDCIRTLPIPISARTFSALVNADPAKAAALSPFSPRIGKPRSGSGQQRRAAFTPAEFEAALARIAGDASKRGLDEICGDGVPIYAIRDRCKRNEEFRDRYRAAVAEHYCRAGVERFAPGRRRHQPEEYFEALSRLKAGKVYSVTRAIDGLERVPSRAAFYGFARRNEAFAREIHDIAAKSAKKRAWTHRPPSPTPLTKDQLRRPLLENDLYRNATRLLRLADNQDADDIRMDAIVAMLESREVRRRDLMRQHYRKVSSFGMKSTDESMLTDSAATLGDLIRNPDDMVWGL